MKLIKVTFLLLFVLGWIDCVVAKTFSNELIVYVIRPKHRLNWTSPKSIALTTAINSYKDDYAPIGHFAVELNCDSPNKYGIKHIFTGMERKNKKESREITLKKKLGLGSVFHDFEGALQSADQSAREVEMARRDGRLTTVIIPTSASRCQKALEFVDNWIEHGSYTVYGGNKDFMKGEGAGCADFALEFFRVATSVVPRNDIMVRVRVPNRLIGDGKDIQVPFPRILRTNSWGKDDTDSRLYVTPDTNKVIDFLYKDTLTIDDQYTYIMHLDPNHTLVTNDTTVNLIEELEAKAQALPPYEIDKYDFKYKYEKREFTYESWNKISVK